MSEIKMIPVQQIFPNPMQPRKEFPKAEIQSLANSIKETSMVQAIVVEGPVNDRYFLVDGERRLRATKLLGKAEIRCEVREPSDQEHNLVDAMVANLQRADLNPIEEAQAYKKLKEIGYSNVEISLKFGITSARVGNYLQLLEFEPEVQSLLASEKLSHDYHLVDALLTLPAGKVRVKAAQEIADRHATIKAGVEACRRIVQHLSEEAISGNEPPAMQIARKRVSSVSRPVWDAQSALGRVPPWPLVNICMRETCDSCGLRDIASATTCDGCTMVELLVRMIKGTTK